MSEVHEFKAETSRLLDLVVNSLYTTKDIFLRELISNSSDALDRLRFEVLTRPELVAPDHPYEIRLEHDAATRTLTVHDTGIGMTREEVVENLGTIAKSGTRELLDRAADAADPEVLSRLIGQFGVGFYSAFMVANTVVVVTRRPGEATATRWESAGDGRFTVTETVRESCGTSVTLHLEPVDEEAGIHDYTDPRVLERIVRRYSDYITHPIRTTVPGDEEGSTEERVLNAMQPIWTRPPSEVGEDEYAEFYRHLTHDWTAPLRTLPLRAEGRTEYRALLFIPAQAPFDLSPEHGRWGLQLYAKQVMIMERCEDLLPPYLRFVRGVVDSADLPLNVSREMLQQDRHMNQMRRWLTGRVLKALDDMQRQDEDAYLEFWRHFGRILKEGVSGDEANRSRLVPLLRFASCHGEKAEESVSLAAYRERMQEGQEAVYYLTGESRTVLERSPHLESFRDRGIEVLLMTDPVDELVVQALTEVDGTPLRSVAKGEVELGSEEERTRTREELESRGRELSDLLSALGHHLDEHVREVRLSTRLKSSPACLVGDEHDLSPQMERFLRASAYELPRQKRILELNPDHPVVQGLKTRYEADHDDPEVPRTAQLLLGYALLAEGSELPDPARFTDLLAQLMERTL